MNQSPKVCFLFLLFLLPAAAWAQSRLVRANNAMRELDYVSAIGLYREVLEKEDSPEAMINLAECYRKTNDSENAEHWYALVVQLPQAKAVHRLNYGMVLQINGKCDQAKTWFAQYLQENPDDARAQFLASSCDRQTELLNKGKDIYTVRNLPFNSDLDDFSPAVVDNTLIFASDRDRGNMIKRTSLWTGNPFSELYSVGFTPNGQQPGDFAYGNPAKYSNTLNTRFHEAAVAVSADGQTIYFTRNSFSEGKTGRSEDGLVKLKIFVGHWNVASHDWKDVQGLPFNSDEYHVAHPTLSPDGRRLYFSSNMPGGYGGMDLYVSTFKDGQWTPPVNLGPVINTEGNEIFPYLAPNNRLYFASNGHLGLGGLDIFYATQQDQNAWNLPVNLGAPVNSTHDDFAITFGPDLSWGFFTSDRSGGAGRDDIYGFQKTAVPVEIVVLDKMTRQPVSGVTVSSVQSGLTMTTGADGKIAFDMRPSDCNDFTASRKGYDGAQMNGCAGTSTEYPMRLEIILQKQSNYILQGIVFDMVDGMPADGAKVSVTNDCGKPAAEPVVTGPDGRYKFKLDRDCCYKVKAERQGYITDSADGFCTKGLTSDKVVLKANLSLQPYRDADGFIVEQKTEPAAPAGPKYNELSGMYENADGSLATFSLGNGLEVQNGVLLADGVPSAPEHPVWKRGSEGFLVNLYYDFNEVNFREESLPDLKKLLRTLQETLELRIEIASHTDARGPAEYNLDLSQRRADRVVQWLIEQGVARERLVARGYGESKPINNCNDDVPCTEAEYQLNRRTEFRVIGQDGK
ncbi:MAG TPA: OmpA family protein [Saprospiraceae bacterium]|nr:OmpA family protein [Saprospiraceae bacterium]HPI05908.1 OmpA family protein [Saprospiraceae bacterium]